MCEEGHVHAWLRRAPLPGRVDLRCPLVVGGVDMLQPGRRKPPAISAPSAASGVTRLRGQKWLSKGACSHSQPQSSTEERRKTAGPPQKPPWIHRQGPSAWCGTGGATARSPRRLQTSLTLQPARSMQIWSHCDQIGHISVSRTCGQFGHIVAKVATISHASTLGSFVTAVAASGGGATGPAPRRWTLPMDPGRFRRRSGGFAALLGGRLKV